MRRHNSSSSRHPIARKTASRCPACGARAGAEVRRFADFPTFLFPMERQVARKVARQELVLHDCSHCGHLYQPRVDSALLDVIYKEHYRNYPYDGSEAMQGPYREPFNRIFELLVHTQRLPEGARLLEIGCSRPENLRPFSMQGFDCVGVDPSPLAKQNSGGSRISMYSGYYETTALPAPFDIIVSRFNLEHIVSPDRMLRKARKELAPGGLLVIQVPNVEYYVSRRQPVFVAHEHIQYFSMCSLYALFARFGFQLVTGYHFEQPSIIACFTRMGRQATTALPARPSFGSYFAEITRRRAKVSTYLQAPGRVVLYGCGLALFSILPGLSSRGLKEIVVVDDNPAYEGAYVPSYDIPVRNMHPALLDGRDTVVLTLNPLYHNQVLAKLRSTGRRLRVVCLGEDGVRELRLSSRN